MATHATPQSEIMSQHAKGTAALQHGHWNTPNGLSRGLARLEQFLASRGYERAPWLAVAFGVGILAWFSLPTPRDWAIFAGLSFSISTFGFVSLRKRAKYPHLQVAIFAIALFLAGGCVSTWVRSILVGVAPISHSMVGTVRAKILRVQAQPALGRDRLTVAMRDIETDRAIKVRLNVPIKSGIPRLAAGDVIVAKVRLMPPAPPMVPGAYNFARTAWFSGLSATGSVIGSVTIVSYGARNKSLEDMRMRLFSHIRSRLPAASAGIAAALATGDTGAIAASDAQAMRDAGLAHLLSISGLHVSAVIGAAYLIILRLSALWPWLALRIRLPILAAAGGAVFGVGYTLLTGAQVPTIRSCIGALLVLAAMMLGREALSLRMLAVAAFLVLLVWPEAVTGPSFQMSFAAVLAIISLGSAQPVRQFLAPREEGAVMRILRAAAMILVTGIVIELALMPITLFHFHRAGVYGALANVLAIPLTTFLVMPSLALALLLDVLSLGAPVWWGVDKAISLLIWLAHTVGDRPGAVTMLSSMGPVAFALFAAGGIWLALWRGRLRLLGLGPALAGTLWLTTLSPPDILVTGDGHQVAMLTDGGGDLLLLRRTRSSYTPDNLREMAGFPGEPSPVDRWPGSRCNRDFCFVEMTRGGRIWKLLLSRSQNMVPIRQLEKACQGVDIVISDRRLPRRCHPRWLKADRQILSRTGGLAIDLVHHTVKTVTEEQGAHGWWQLQPLRPRSSN